MRCTEPHFSASYEAIHRYDDAVVEHAKHDAIVPCAVQPRDLEIVLAVWRHKYLTTPQLLELWWPGRAAWGGQRRLLKLFHAGYLDRFRPVARRGSFPWTYRIDRGGLQLLKAAGAIERRERYEHQVIYDYRYVLHEVQLNAWVIAWTRLLGHLLLDWSGESAIEPPQGLQVERPLRLDGTDWSAEDLRDPKPRVLRPDAILEVERKDGESSRIFLIEYDRTGRPDKNLEKLRRYDAFLTWWWRHTAYRDHGSPPWVVFVCQSSDDCDRFLTAADYELTGHHWHPSRRAEDDDYVGRSRILFASDSDMHFGGQADGSSPKLSAWPHDAGPRNGGAPHSSPGRNAEWLSRVVFSWCWCLGVGSRCWS